jgi:hypothetical protein
VRAEGLCQLKIPVTPSGIEHVALWLVAQCLDQLRHCVPLERDEDKKFMKKGKR